MMANDLPALDPERDRSASRSTSRPSLSGPPTPNPTAAGATRHAGSKSPELPAATRTIAGHGIAVGAFLPDPTAQRPASQGSLLGSVSAYYYTPAQAIFVGGLVGLGTCMIALKGTTEVEDILLDLGGVFAILVAVVPTGRGADYRAAVLACRDAGTPLLTEKASTQLDCPTVRALAEATSANVDNNLTAVLVVGLVALVVAIAFALKDGTISSEQDKDTRRNFLFGFVAAFVVWVATLVARLASLQWVVENMHWIAAVLLFVCVIGVALQNSLRVDHKEPRSKSLPTQSPMQQAMTTAGATINEFIALRQRSNRYIWIARVMLLVAAITTALWGTGVITLFWLEAAIFMFFADFWVAQTIEFEEALS